MATMNLRISGNKSKKTSAVKVFLTHTRFPAHCLGFFEAQKSAVLTFEAEKLGANFITQVCESRASEEILKELKDLAKQDWPNNLPSKEACACFEFLISLYFLSDHQGHVKNAILKILEHNSKNEQALADSHRLLKSYLQCGLEKVEDQNFVAGTLIHLAKSSLLAEKLILPCWMEVIQLLSTAVQMHREKFESFSELAAVKQQVLFGGLHLLSQATGGVIQLANKKSSSSLGAEEFLLVLFQEFVQIMNNPPSQLPSDTLNSCAMATVLSSDRIEEEVAPKERLHDILGIILERSCNLHFPEWSHLEDCSIAVKFSLCAALLGVYKVEDLSNVKYEGQFVLKLVFDFLSAEVGKSSESSLILGGCRSIASLGRILPQAANLCPELLSTFLSKAIEHCIVHLEHHMDSVRHATKAFLASLLTACKSDQSCSTAVIQSFKALPADSKAKFFGVAALSTSLGAVTVLEEFPDLVKWLLDSLKSTTLAPHASSTLEMLMRNHINPDVPVDEWCSTWITPVVHLMPCPALDPVLAKAVQLRPQTLTFIIGICSSELTSKTPGSLESTNRLKVLLGCLKMAKKFSRGNENQWMSVIGLQQLTFALCHSEDEVRLAALALITETRKSTEPLTPIEMMSLLTGFKYCADTEAPSTSHNAIAILKKLFCRLSDSYRATARLGKPCDGYRSFVAHICENAFSDLFPGSSVCRRSFSLQALSLFRDILSTEEPWSDVWQKQMTKEHAEVLLGCFSDTFEGNKKMALELLKTFPAEALSFNDKATLKHLLDKSLTLSESHRPPDCAVSACALSLIVACTGAHGVLSEICNEPAQFSSGLMVSQVLLKRLEIQLAVAKDSILRASASGPMYGTLFCLRTLIIDQDLQTVSKGLENSHWKELIDKLVKICFEMNATVAPVVNSSSPEGHLPMDFEKDIELPSEMETLSVAEADSMPKVTAQMVLLCAWRTVKEVSLTLGDLAAKAPASNTDQYLLSNEQLFQIGEHFTSLLCETKHRGAFEQAYVGFCKLCSWLWKVPIGELPQLPSKWLDELMVGISGSNSEPSSIKLAKLCTTRRSAGVPFIVQALITTELEVRAKPECFHRTVATLLVLAKDSGSAGQLHALNILRALFRSAYLGEHVAPYVSDGFLATINAFKSSNWAERNAATLLFSALMGRVFGVRHTPGHEDLPRKNRMTGRIFFRLYPKLFGLLSEELKSVSGSIKDGQEVAGSLYPVLLLLARLYPSSLEGTDSSLNLLSLLDDVSICTASPVMHTRVLAAKALVPLVEPQQASNYVRSISICPQPQNILHGKLLQLSKLAKEVVLSDDVKVAYEEKFKEGSYLLDTEHNCPVTKGAFIDVVLEFISRCNQIEDKATISYLKEKLPTVLDSPENFGFVITKQKAARLMLHVILCTQDFNVIEQTLIQILNHPLPEVVQEACNFIINQTDGSIDEIHGDSIKLLGLKRESSKTIGSQLLGSKKIGACIIKRALLLSPKEGQSAQFETRISVYFACMRLSNSIMEADWSTEGKHLNDPEQKIALLLNYVEEQRLGPANYAILALAGALLNNLKARPSEFLAENYASALLNCALSDSCSESSLVVAQSLRKNKILLFQTFGKTTATSFCAAMILLQLSSPSIRDIVLQIYPGMMGVTKSRAIEALALNFAATDISLEQKIATLLLWAFGDTILDEMSADEESDTTDEGHERVFEQGEVTANLEELKQTEAAASALASLILKNGKDKVISVLNSPIEWIPSCNLGKPITCGEILCRAKRTLVGSKTHFLDYQHQLAVFNRLQFNEVDKTGLFEFI